MSDIFWQALIGGVVALGLGYMQFRTQVALSKLTRESNYHVETLKQGQANILKSTDGMKDALVAAALKDGKQIGKEQEQANPTSVSAPLSEAVGRRKDDA